MLRERAEYYYNNFNYNCAETIIHAANDVYQLGMSEETMKIVGGFGGGMGCGQACGALCGGVCVISQAKIETTAHEAPELRASTTKFVAAFRRILGGTLCKELMPKYKKPDTRCLETILLGCDALEEVMGRPQD